MAERPDDRAASPARGRCARTALPLPPATSKSSSPVPRFRPPARCSTGPAVRRPRSRISRVYASRHDACATPVGPVRELTGEEKPPDHVRPPAGAVSGRLEPRADRRPARGAEAVLVGGLAVEGGPAVAGGQPEQAARRARERGCAARTADGRGPSVRAIDGEAALRAVKVEHRNLLSDEGIPPTTGLGRPTDASAGAESRLGTSLRRCPARAASVAASDDDDRRHRRRSRRA